jgi:hypothetical protein
MKKVRKKQMINQERQIRDKKTRCASTGHDERKLHPSIHTNSLPQTQTKTIPIVDNRGHTVGRVRETTFEKELNGSKHFLRVPSAIAFDLVTLERAKQAGADKTRIIDKDTGIIYRATFSQIEIKGFKFNRGYGEQIALGLHLWEHEGTKPAKNQAELFEGVNSSTPEQLTLTGV